MSIRTQHIMSWDRARGLHARRRVFTQQDFDAFARESELANISEAAKTIITEERDRLGIKTENGISIDEDDS